MRSCTSRLMSRNFGWEAPPTHSKAQPSVVVDERVTSGPGSKAESQSRVTGEELLQSFPYGAGEGYALPTPGKTNPFSPSNSAA